jgi:hypothetical protein
MAAVFDVVEPESEPPPPQPVSNTERTKAVNIFILIVQIKKPIY